MALALVVGACDPGLGPSPAPLSATGLVIAANGPDLASVTTFTLQTDDGRKLDFVVGTLDVTDGGLPAPHLREHMAGSTSTTVYYRIDHDTGQNVAVKYTDAGE